MKKILIIGNSLSGLYSFRKEVVKAIVDEGYEVHISIPDFDSECVPFFKEMGCYIDPIVFDRRGMNPTSDFRLMLKYCKLMRRLKPVAVLTYTIKPNVYGGMAARLLRVPQLANVTGLGDAIENGGWLQKLAVTLYRIGLGKAQRVFFQNNSNRELCISKGIADDKSVLLPGSGVNIHYHTYQDYPQDGVIKFIFITRLLKDKGTDEFFEMAQSIKAKYTHTEFQILGSVEGDYQQRLDKLVGAGIVKFLGITLDVRPYLGAIHCAIMPSYHEGMSNVNLESAANGRPVITTDVPGCRETVDDGKSGYLVKPRSAKSLMEAVERFINLPYDQKIMMGQNGRKKVEREFDRQLVVNTYLNEIKKIDHV